MNKFFSRAGAVIAIAFSALAFAQDTSKEPLKIGGPEANIKRLMEAKLRPGTVVDGVTKTAYFGLYEVRYQGSSGTEIIYTDERLTYIFAGTVIDGRSLENLTEQRLEALATIKFDDLPVANSIKIVNGNGKRKLAYFADPNCGFCKKFERETLASLKDTTIYLYMYPIIRPPDSVTKSKQVWCAADRAKAWNDYMLKGQALSGTSSCENPVDSLLALGQRLRVAATPAVFLPNGKRISGAVPLAQLEAALNEASK